MARSLAVLDAIRDVRLDRLRVVVVDDRAVYGGKALEWLFFVVRGDRFYEHQATDSFGRASAPIFWNGVECVSSLTATTELKPHDNISFRLEFRHDQADGLLYLTGDTLVGDGSTNNPYLPNARRQQTLLLGATAWF